MNLHRTDGQPEWESVPASNYNIWQKTAAQTDGLLTPGNIITGIGLLAVIVALLLLGRHDYWLSLLFLAAGRLCDIADGLVAEATGTKSPRGEQFDAVADKIATGLIVGGLLAFQLIPWWALLLLLVPQAFNTILVLAARRQRIVLHPSKIGKLSMLATWVSILALVLGVAIPVHAGIYKAVAYGMVMLASCLGIYATFEYLAEARKTAK